MDSKKSEVFKVRTTIPSGVGPLIHEESNDVSQSNAENFDKKKLITGTDCGSAIDATSAQDKQDATKGASIDDEDFSLRLESSDEDTFRDAIDAGGASKGVAIDAKSNKSETLFSDIESSDDSIIYEPKSKSVVDLLGGAGQSGEMRSTETTAMSGGIGEEKKVIESEFDLVESDEEFFEDLPLPEKPDQLSQETISDKTFAEEEDEEERNSTPLIDEESNKSTQLDLQLEGLKPIESNLEPTGSSIITSDQSMDLMLESSVDSTDPSNTENILATTETRLSHDLADDQSTEVDDKESSIDPMIPDAMEESNALPASSQESKTTKPDSLEIDMFTSESSNQEEISCDKTINTLQISSSIPATNEKSEKLIEALATVDLETSESPKKVHELPQDSKNIPMSLTTSEDKPEIMETDVGTPKEGDFKSCKSSKEIPESHDLENISMSPTLIEDENISTSFQPEIVETDVEMTEKQNLDGDEKMKGNLLKDDVNDSLTSENENLVVEEPMKIDDTIFDVSGVSEMEAIEEDTTMEKSDDQFLDQNESHMHTEKEANLEAVNDEDINLKSDEDPEVNKEVTIADANISDTNEQLMDKPIDKSTKTSVIDDKFSELEQSPLKLTEPSKTAKSPDLIEMHKADKSDSSVKADDSTALIEEHPITETKTDDTLVTLSKLSTDGEIKELESIEKVNLDDGTEKNDKEADLLDTSDGAVKSHEGVPDETEKLSEITPKPLEPIEKLPKTSEICVEDQMKDSTETTAQKQNTDGISKEYMEKTMQTSEKSNEKIESPKKIQEKFEKTEVSGSITDGAETIKSPQKSVEMSHESNNKQLEPTEKSKKIDEFSQEEELKPSEEPSKHTKQQCANNEESLIETVELVDESDEHVGDLMETNESLQKVEKTSQESNKQENATQGSPQPIVDNIEKTAASETDSIEKQTFLKDIYVRKETESIEKQISEKTVSTEKQAFLKEIVVCQQTDSIGKQETQKETAASQKTDSFEKEELLKETVVSQKTDSIENQASLIEPAISEEINSIEKQELLKETAASQDTESLEKNGPLKETAVTQKPNSIEKQDSLQKTAAPEETHSIEKQELINETAASKETAASLETADPKKSEKIEAIKSTEVISSIIETVETSRVVTETVVENVVEGATSTVSTKPKQIIDSGAGQDTQKPPAKIDPEIIEIDDDDDLEEEKKLEDNSKKDEKVSTSTSDEKEPQDKKTDESTKVSRNKEAKELVVPMDVDEEITTDKSAKKPEIENQATNQDATTAQESAVKDGNATMKGIPVQVLDDDEEPLLMIDTSHKEDNDTESNFMGNETATSAPTTDSSSDGSLEVFYDKECVNYECKRASKNFYRATVFAMNFFKVSKKRTKTQFVCEDCYDRALSSYEELCKTLKHKQPLLHGTTFKCQEFVEIIDSSDEDESDTGLDKGKVSDENALPKESIEMLEAELEGAIRKVMHSVDIQNQLSWTKQILQQRLTNLQDDSDFVTEQLRALQRKADQMHNSLYQCPKIKLRQLTPLDLNSGRMYNPESDNSTSIPLPGDIIRNPICVNEQYYAVKTKAIASWVPCKVIEEVEGYAAVYNNTKTYKIKFTKLAKYPMFKTVYAKHMAYYDPPNVRLPIGSRVIAYFDATSLSRGKEKMLIPSAFYPGIIAEPLKQSNKFRYLVFYDDGYFQYVNHKDVRLVCQASENVWEDVHHQSREFIHNYLTQYAVNRPMVQTQKGQSMLVDYNGKWIYARVIDVDCSLVQMLFEGQSRSEWIYRGSTRLGPVYKESNNLSQKNTLNATRRRTEPFIRYINGDDSSSSQQVQETEQPQAKAGSSEIRSVAKKSVSRVDTSNNNNNTTTSSSAAQQPVPTVRHLNNSTIFVDDDNKPKGKVVYYTARKNLPPRNYVPHICNPSCPFNITHNLSFYSPLAKPLLSGWERQVFRQKSKKFIIYRGPCGKRMRNIEELHRYLRVTDNELNVDNFDFSPDTNCLAEYVLEKCLVNKKDISCGKEKMPIPCVNYYDETMPPACEYSAVRIPTEGVPLNLDEEFLCGCDCEDDCSDKTKCACWQLTYAGAKYGMPTVPTEMVGYQYKRLYEHVPTGIYECNSRCKCKASCVNRVVQQPLQSKLQVFKTSNRGWGLRCINDVPRGSFICVYAGQMLTEQVANEGGLDAGDEYFAELDYIEVAEQIKEGYESDVQEPEEDEDLYNPEREDDDIDFRAPGESFKDKEFNTRLRARKGNKNSTDGEFDSQERQVISFEPNKNMDTSNEPNEKPTIRKLFGKDESCYVMDAKVRGNLGRYFNHSCSPNLFVQNVFVDTHDLRFPWVAFFASTHIRAGTELTWNYNYEVGVVPGKVLYCQCGAPNCRQRLL